MSLEDPTAAPHPDPTSVSTHILDTSAGRPAQDVAVQVSVRDGDDRDWVAHAASRTDADGRCKNLPDLPAGTTQVRLRFEVEPYFARTADHRTDDAADADGGSFFPEVAITFAVKRGEHYHVPLLLNPFGYSVYRGS